MTQGGIGAATLICVTLTRWWDSMLFVGAVLVAVISVVCAQFVKEDNGALRVGWLVGQIACVGLAVIIPSITAQLARRSEINALTQTRLELNSGLDPVVRKLGELSLMTTKQAQEPLRAEIMALVIVAAHQVLGSSGATRSCYFKLTSGPPKKLLPTNHHGGRPGSARSSFAEGTDAGDAAIRLVEENDYWLCRDVKKNPPPGWDSSVKRDYQSFISVAVVADNIGYGMLTVDSRKQHDFDRGDVDLLRVLAGLLAASLASNGE